MSFADRLNSLLDSRRESQSALARAIGLTPSSVHAWTTGEAVPSLAKAIELAKHLGVTLDSLFGEGQAPAQDAAPEETEQQRTLRRMVETIGFDEAMRRLMVVPGVQPLHDRPTYGERAGGGRTNGGEAAPRLKRDA